MTFRLNMLKSLLLPRQAPIWPVRGVQMDPDVAALRRYTQRRDRAVARDGTPRPWWAALIHVLAALLWPLNAAARAWHVAGLRADFAHAVAPVPRDRLATALGLWRLAIQDNIDPETAARFRLLDGANRALAHAFLSDAESGHVLRDIWRLIDPAVAEQANDKLRFHDLCVRRGLPTVPILATCVDGGPVRWADGSGQIPQTDLVVKVTTSVGGQGVELLRYDSQAMVHACGSARLQADELSAWLRSKSRRTTVIVQPRVMNHPQIAPLAASALSSLRIVTAIDSDGVPAVACAAMRMGVGPAIVDNISAGGLAAAVDVGTGRIRGPAAAKSVVRGWFDRHPDTQALIDGFQVPHWAQVLDLARQIHAAVPGIPTVGWDVVVTPQGPMLLEGNVVWGSDLVQTCGIVPLGRTCAASAMARALGLPQPKWREVAA